MSVICSTFFYLFVATLLLLLKRRVLSKRTETVGVFSDACVVPVVVVGGISLLEVTKGHILLGLLILDGIVALKLMVCEFF